MENALLISVLFIFSFLAPSPFPVPTDAYAAGLAIHGTSLIAIFTILLIGHLCGLLFFRYIGYRSGKFVRHWEKHHKGRFYKVANKLYLRYGKYSLLLSSIPFISKPLIVTAGIFDMGFMEMILWYGLGKVVWYGSIILISGGLTAMIH